MESKSVLTSCHLARGHSISLRNEIRNEQFPTYVKKFWPQLKAEAVIPMAGSKISATSAVIRSWAPPGGDAPHPEAFRAVLWRCLSFSLGGGRDPETALRHLTFR